MDPLSICLGVVAAGKAIDKALDLAEDFVLPKWEKYREERYVQAREAQLVREGRKLGPAALSLIWEVVPSPGMWRAGWEGPFFVLCPPSEGEGAPRARVAARLMSSLWMTSPKQLGALLRAQRFGEGVKAFLEARGLPPGMDEPVAVVALLQAVLGLPPEEITPTLLGGLVGAPGKAAPLLMVDSRGEYYPEGLPPCHLLAGSCRNTDWRGDEHPQGCPKGRHYIQL